MDFLVGGVAAMGAVVFSNPLDVVKTRMQLQGELKSKGNYAVHYRSVPHAVYMIAKNDGILALQKGLVPALGFQLVANSIRLGLYQTAETNLLTKNKSGETDVLKSILFASLAGFTSAFVASPLYLVKVHVQSSSHQSIAVGYQHHYSGTIGAFREIYRRDGIRGLLRGWQGSVVRTGIGSAVQLMTFARSKDILRNNNILVDSPISSAFVASNVSGLALAIFMCPFDVMSTRLYNQDTDRSGKGRMYSGVMDCLMKIVRAEGVYGLYKGVGPLYLRAAPHTVLCLIFWDYLKDLTNKFKLNQSTT